MAKKNRVLKYCEQCKKKTTHEVINTNGQESFVCLADKKRAYEMENARIADLNQKETVRNEADRIIMEEKVRQLSNRYGSNWY